MDAHWTGHWTFRPITISTLSMRYPGPKRVQDNSAQNQLGPHKTRPMPTRPKMLLYYLHYIYIIYIKEPLKNPARGDKKPTIISVFLQHCQLALHDLEREYPDDAGVLDYYIVYNLEPQAGLFWCKLPSLPLYTGLGYLTLHYTLPHHMMKGLIQGREP